MSSATLAHDETHDAHEAHHTSFPIDNRKLAIWSFIGSECLFFATLISTFLIYKDNHPKGPGPKDIFEVGLVATLQAFIFTTLAAIYLGGAVAEEH